MNDAETNYKNLYEKLKKVHKANISHIADLEIEAIELKNDIELYESESEKHNQNNMQFKSIAFDLITKIFIEYKHTKIIDMGATRARNIYGTIRGIRIEIKLELYEKHRTIVIDRYEDEINNDFKFYLFRGNIKDTGDTNNLIGQTNSIEKLIKKIKNCPTNIN